MLGEVWPVVALEVLQSRREVKGECLSLRLNAGTAALNGCLDVCLGRS